MVDNLETPQLSAGGSVLFVTIAGAGGSAKSLLAGPA
jgi:hypothetical protein